MCTLSVHECAADFRLGAQTNSANLSIPAGTVGTVIRVVGDSSGPFDCIFADFGAALNPDKLISMGQAAAEIEIVSDAVRT
jgi:hypothetical protein